MSHKLHNYLRTHRKKSGLSQAEVALLLGTMHRARVSRHERLSRHPEVGAVFAYEIIFCVPARELFPGSYEKVERATAKRAIALAERLASREPSRALSRKLATLQAIAALVTGIPERNP